MTHPLSNKGLKIEEVLAYIESLCLIQVWLVFIKISRPHILLLLMLILLEFTARAACKTRSVECWGGLWKAWSSSLLRDDKFLSAYKFFSDLLNGVSLLCSCRLPLPTL